MKTGAGAMAALMMVMVVQGVIFARTAHAQSSPLDLTAKVGDVKETKPNPCVEATQQGATYARYFGLKPNKSRFNLVNRKGLRYRINVKALFSKEIEKANFYLFNTGAGIIDKDPCTQGGDVSRHFYAFSVHDLKNPEDGVISPHALIYIPLNFKAQVDPYLADEFHLVVLTIETDENKCTTYGAETQRCHALHRIYKLTKSGEPAHRFIAEVQKDIGVILPPTYATVPEAPEVKRAYGPLGTLFHNGVIHGSF